MLHDILALNIFAFMIVFARMGTALSLMPGFSAPYIPMHMRLIFALVVAVVVTPIVAPMVSAVPGSPMALFLVLLGEATIGAFFGLIGRIVFGSLQVAGTMIALVSSMANAFIHDAIAEQQGSVLSGFLSTLGVVVVFVTGAHHLMLRAVTESYIVFLPGNALMIQDFAMMMARNVGDSFNLGVQISSPLIVTSLVHYIMLGILGRLMPTLPVFFFGLPIQLALQIFVLALALASMMMVFTNHFADVFGAFVGP